MTKNFSTYSRLEAEAKSENTSGDRLWELAQIDNNLALIVAQNVAAPAKLLEQLSNNANSSLKKAVCANANTPIDILWKLAIKFPQQLLENPILDCLFLENSHLLDNIPIKVLKKLLKLTEVPEYLQQLASNSKQENIRRTVAENPNTSLDILEKLASDLNEEVRDAVVKNPHLKSLVTPL
jgi:hypothetical protein